MGGQVGSDDGDVGFQIAPMVDIVFVLLLFFMASAGVQVKELELSVNLPGGKPGGDIIVPIFIDITTSGQALVNGTPKDDTTSADMVELTAFLKTAVDMSKGKDPVIIRPEASTRHARIVDILNAASAAGVKTLTFS